MRLLEDKERMIAFIQHDIPGLEDGNFQLKISQVITDDGGDKVSDETLTAAYAFAVTGDRFALSQPGQTIYSVYPAENATGRYGSVLPHVVFNKTSFPWTRTPLQEKSKRVALKAGVDTDEDVPVWLTVLVLDEQELGGDQNIKIVAVRDLFPPSVVKESSLGDHYSYFYQLKDREVRPETMLEPGIMLTDSIQVLDIDTGLFRTLAPSVEDLKLMGHVRKVSLQDKATMPGISDAGTSEGRFSIVFGNRLPAEERKNYAFLVSLEGLEEFLPGQENVTLDTGNKLRLAVLKSWSFYTTGDNAQFVDRVNRLNGGEETIEAEVNEDLLLMTSFGLSVPEESMKEVRGALERGYVPLNHDLRSGRENDIFTVDKTVSWCRGPLVPYRVERNLKLPAASADYLLRFDPSTGMLDVSYASAWMLGRQLALQDKEFATRLFNWNTNREKAMRRQVERFELNERLELSPETELNDLLKNTIMSLKLRKKYDEEK